MAYFLEGAMIARMAQVACRRRLKKDTALGLLEEMLDGLDLPGVEFPLTENWPGHPLGDLIIEAFGEGRKFPALAASNPSHPADYADISTGDHSDGMAFTPQQEAVEAESYLIVLDRFRERFGF